MVNLSVILPTYNEAENIVELINRVLASSESVSEVIVVDDDSPDKTWKLAEKIAEDDGRVRVIRRIGVRGLPSAIADGIEAAVGDAVAWMDCDLCHPPELIAKLVGRLPEYDVAIGSRYASGGGDNREFLRILTSIVINGFAVLLLGWGVRDYTTGFVVAKKRVFDEVSLMRTGYGQYCIDFLYKAKKKGFRITEVGFEFTDRSRGQSKSSSGLVSSVKYFFAYIRTIIRLRLGWN